MQVSLVIPNYNGKRLLAKNLPKVINNSPGVEVIIVDDGSDDGSSQWLKANFPKIKLIEIVNNQGFSTSVNLGVKAAKGEIVILLNTDVVPEKGWLKPLLAHFADLQVFAVGCLDKSYEKGKIVKRGRGIGKFERGFLVHQRGEVDRSDTLWVNGGSGAYRKSIWDKLGGMDEIYNPFYWEDIDLSYRALKAGFKIIFESQSVVEHRHEEGSIKQKYLTNQIKTIAYRNQFIFVWKNITDTKYLVQHFSWLSYHIFTRLVRGDACFFSGLFKAIVKLPEIISKRKTEVKFYLKKDGQII